jgi:hypothetical protein
VEAAKQKGEKRKKPKPGEQEGMPLSFNASPGFGQETTIAIMNCAISFI